MTPLASSRTSPFPTILMAVLMACILGAALVLMVMYNRLINTEGRIALVTEQINRLQAENSDLQDKTVGLFSSEVLEQIARDRGYVKERTPRYVTVSTPWLFASR